MTLFLALSVIYTFSRAQLVACTDGDTCRFNFHEWHPVMGAVTYRNHTVRLAGVDAPELHPARCEAKRELGQKARDRLLALLRGAHSISVEVLKARDKYGRMIAKVRADGQDVAETLIAEGLGRKYTGRGKRQGWCG